MQEYPKMVYRSEQDYKIAEDEQEQEVLESQGYRDYFEMMADAADVDQGGDKVLTKPQIIEKLTELGVEFNPRDKKEDLLTLLSSTENPET